MKSDTRRRWLAVPLLLALASPVFGHHISGKVFCDDDYDGVIDGGDDELSGITARATSLDAAPGSTFSDATDGNGFYEIGLPGRTDRYRVELIGLPGGWVVVLPAGGSHTVQIITGGPNDHKDDVNFLVQGCAPGTTTTTTTKPPTTSTTTTRPPTTTTRPPTTTTTTSTSTTSPSTTSTTVPGCVCSGTPFLLGKDAKFNNDGDLRGSIGTNDPNGRLQIGKNVRMADGTSVTANDLTVGNGSSVYQAFANTLKLGAGAETRNGFGPAALPIVAPFCPIPTFDCGTQHITVGPAQTIGLAPGKYGKLKVLNGATLELQPGTYQFCDLKTGRGATISALGDVTIDIVGGLIVGTDSHMAPVAGAPIIKVNVAGKKVRVSQSAVANAKISAPNAKSQFGRDSMLLGCFCAGSGRSDKHITLECDPS